MSFNDNLGPIISGNTHINSTLLPYPNQFKVAHMNCRSISPSASTVKLDELRSILNGNIFDVFAVSESWLNKFTSNRAVEIPGYRICRNDRPYPSRGGGVAIYISKRIKFRLVHKLLIAECESLFVECDVGGVKLLLGVVYLPNGNLVAFERRHGDLFSKYSNIIVTGDFNYNLFDSSKANLFRSFCLRCNLSVAHNSMPTHFDLGRRTTSLIDFFLVSNISMLTFSKQVQIPSLTDHAFIYASFVFSIERLDEFIEYRDVNAIDWDGLFRFLSGYDHSSIYNAVDVDIKSSIICSLFESLYSFVPVVRRRVQFSDNDWMKSRDIVLARSLRDLSFSAYQSDRSWQNWRAYCKLRNKAKNVIRKRKREHFSKLFDGLGSAGLWKVFRNSGCVGVDEVVLEDDVDTINDYFVNTGENDHGYIDLNSLNDSDDSFSFCCVSEMELFEALHKVKSKSVGVDGIPIQFIKLVFPYISGLILHFVNTILTTSIFPMAWKIARVVPIPKSRLVRGPDDLRPISILPALSKVTEHILKNQMLQATLGRIYESQYAFRKGYNTTSLLLNLTDSIRENINNDKLSVLVSLDLSKAFNSINFVTMVLKLKNEYNFSKSACRLILSYLNGRSQFVVANGIESGVLPLYSGVPQGSVMGPLLFILYINDLPELTSTRFCKTFLFADDVFLLFTGNRRYSEVFESNINSCLDRVLQWSNANSLTINSSKSKAMQFGPTNRFYLELNVFLGDEEIQFVNHHRCLGITLDSKLSFKYHIDALSGRVWASLRRIYHTNIFLPFRIKRMLAFALLMSLVLYGLEVFTGTIGINFTRLKRIVNTIVRFVYNIPRRDHISGHVKRFLGCSFKNFVNYRNLTLFHRVIKSRTPSGLYNTFVFSRSRRNRQIVIPLIVRSAFERSYLIRIARSWNMLPYYLRVFSQSNNVFRLKLMEYYNELDL